ncbi:MAG: TIGR02253 family HAD-type hydrolase [Anaerolineales bacterium]
MHPFSQTSHPLNGHIRALFFDLDGTLCHDAPSSHETFFNFAVQLGAPDTPPNRIPALRWAHAYWADRQLIAADIAQYGRHTPQFWENYTRGYLRAYGCTPEHAQTLAPLLHARLTKDHHPTNLLAPDAHPTLTALQHTGYTLGLITNRTQPCHAELQTLGIAHYFDLILTAGEVNAFKPDPAIFQHALTQTGIPPQAALYIGDNYYADILGAAQAGMIPVLLDPERVFPEAACPVITSLSALLPLLKHG